MGIKIQDGCIVFYQSDEGEFVSIPAGGFVSADPEMLKN